MESVCHARHLTNRYLRTLEGHGYGGIGDLGINDYISDKQ
jgi:hypothetical protein